jgi:uncharacterized membrane protein (DUF106 family)
MTSFTSSSTLPQINKKNLYLNSSKYLPMSVFLFLAILVGVYFTIVKTLGFLIDYIFRDLDD